MISEEGGERAPDEGLPVPRLPPGFSPGRDPLDGDPERRVRLVRGLAELLRWVAGLAGPIPILGLVSPWARGLPPALRPVAALAVYLGAAAALMVAVGAAARRIAVARRVRTGADGFEIGGERLWFRECSEWVGDGPVGPEGLRVPWDRVRALYRVDLGGGDAAVGAWFQDRAGRTLETWLRFPVREADELVSTMASASGCPVRRSRGPEAPDATPTGELP